MPELSTSWIQQPEDTAALIITGVFKVGRFSHDNLLHSFYINVNCFCFIIHHRFYAYGMTLYSISRRHFWLLFGLRNRVTTWKTSDIFFNVLKIYSYYTFRPDKRVFEESGSSKTAVIGCLWLTGVCRVWLVFIFKKNRCSAVWLECNHHCKRATWENMKGTDCGWFAGRQSSTTAHEMSCLDWQHHSRVDPGIPGPLLCQNGQKTLTACFWFKGCPLLCTLER